MTGDRIYRFQFDSRNKLTIATKNVKLCMDVFNTATNLYMKHLCVYVSNMTDMRNFEVVDYWECILVKIVGRIRSLIYLLNNYYKPLCIDRSFRRQVDMINYFLNFLFSVGNVQAFL
jgi:hypothetical protein